MKKILFASVFILASIISFSQVPKGFNYQAVLRNSSGDLITGQTVDIEISIIDESSGGPILYTETHTKTTNSYGLVNLIIGSEIPDFGVFSDINWAVNDKFIQIKVDGTNMGTFQLLTVPFAMHAASATNLGSENVYTGTDTLFVVKDAEGNPVFVVFPDGAKVIVEEATKGTVGGFAVSGRSPTKAEETDIFRITPDSTRVYVNDTVQSKGTVGGFAVSGRSPTKGISKEYLIVTQDSTRVYISDTSLTKGRVGGFAVSGRSPTKAETKDYFNISGNTVADVIENESRVMWYPKKAAFLAGEIYVSGPESVGTNSTAIGYRNIAKGEYSQAFGYQSAARGDYSTAIGLEAKAEGVNSFAFGESAEAWGEGSYAIGSKGLDVFGGGFGGAVNTKALGYASISIGLGAVSIGEGAIAFGICDTAMGDYSVAMGHGSIASGNFSRTIGIYTKAEGYHSYAFGRHSEALAQDAISLAGESVASGIYSVSLGAQSVASGDYSLTMGMNTKAEQGASVAMGNTTRAAGWGSVAMGYNTIAKPRTLLVIGRNNDTTCISEGFGWWNSLDPAFIIGNGIDENNRSNAFTVLQNGYTAIGHESPTEMLDVDGNAIFRSVSSGPYDRSLNIMLDGTLTTASSDLRLKENITTLENSLQKVKELRGVNFTWISDPEMGNRIGLIAQEVEKVIPELVFTNEVDGYKGVNYAEMSAVLIEAVKEQQTTIEAQQVEISELKSRLAEIEKLLLQK